MNLAAVSLNHRQRPADIVCACVGNDKADLRAAPIPNNYFPALGHPVKLQSGYGLRIIMKPINLADKLALFSTHWDPHVVAEYNDNEVMIVKFKGEYPFHKHETTADFFYVLEGEMEMDIEGQQSKTVKAGELFIVGFSGSRGIDTFNEPQGSGFLGVDICYWVKTWCATRCDAVGYRRQYDGECVSNDHICPGVFQAGHDGGLCPVSQVD